MKFDLDKDAQNIAKHGISLSRASDMDLLAVVPDARFYEPRFRAYGLIDGLPYCLAFAPSSEGYRAISLRRSHQKEFKRYER